MKYPILHILYLLLLAVSLVACREDSTLSVEQEEGVQVSFRLSDTGGATRAISEGVISSLHAIYFDASADTYINMEEITSQLAKKVGDVYTYRLLTAPRNQSIKIAFVANAKTQINANKSSWNTSTTRSVVLNGLVISNASQVGVWKSSETRNIPMYALTPAVTITISSSNPLQILPSSGTSYDLIRMVAKFTIINNYNNITSGLTKIAIQEAYLINGNNEGYVAYGTTETTPNYLKAGSGDKSSQNTANKLSVIVDATNQMEELVFYAFETENTGNIQDDTDNCHILFTAKMGNTNTTKKYMLNIPSTSDPSTVGNVLRNHHYTYRINGAQNYESNTLQVTVTVEDWVDATIEVDLE